MPQKEIKEAGLSWIYLDNTNNDAIKYLKNNYNFHELDLEDIQTGGSQVPKLDIYKNYLFLVIQFPEWHEGKNALSRNEVYIFFGNGYVITIEPEQTKIMDNIFSNCLKNNQIKKDWMGKSSAYLLYNILEAIFHTSQPILSELGKKLTQAEEEIFQDKPDISLIREIAIYRRYILKFRRVIDPQRYIIANLSHIRRSFLDESMGLYFDDLTDFLNKQWSILESFRDTIEGLHVTLETLTTQHTNQTINFLTLISVGLMPLTLLSSIYGMNILHLPFANNPIYVWLLFVLLGIGTARFMIYIRKQQ